MPINPQTGGGGASTPEVRDEWTVISAATTAAAGNGYLVDCSSAAVTLTLPLSPSVGDTVAIADHTGNAATNNITVGRNGVNIDAQAEDLVIDVSKSSIELVYSGATVGWAITNIDMVN